MTEQENQNGWYEWKNHVLIELKRVAEGQDEMRKDIATLKAKSAVWGGAAALLVTTGINVLISFVK